MMERSGMSDWVIQTSMELYRLRAAKENAYGYIGFIKEEMNKEGATTPHDAFYYFFVGRLDAVRRGDWKLVVNGPTRRGNAQENGTPPIRLYDLAEDVGEKTNVAEDHPEVVEDMMKLLEAARVDLGDTATDREGQNRRASGFVEDATTLTKKPTE